MRVLLVVPPMTQLNTPYPATAYLTGFLRRRGVEVRQADPALELVLRLFSRAGLSQAAAEMEKIPKAKRTESVRHFLTELPRILQVTEPAVRFLQGKDPTLGLRIISREFLPEGDRFAPVREFEGALAEAFGGLGVHDQAKYLASLFLDDLSDALREGVDARFEFSRYGEKLAASAATFTALQEAIRGEPTLVDRVLDEIAHQLISEAQPDLLGLTVPFPGNVYGAFRIAQVAKSFGPESPAVVMGGGYANTELRSLSDPAVFDYVDYITLDDGERPILCLLEHLQGKRPASRLLRTFVREQGKVVFHSDPREHDIPHKEVGPPVYDGLPLDRYLSVFEMLNPMHRIWSDGRWNKLTLAHGCYWKKCSFCDVSLDYIGRYDAAPAAALADRMDAVVQETGQSGFHFVDEAAPPALLKALGQELIARGRTYTWWGNIRFEKAFTPELCRKLSQSGCVAVSGGLEVASDRLLKLMDKGVTVEQVARVTHAFSQAGILVHAYLMYGFPSQTEAETIDALERVRQLFEAGCIQSAYWHRFSVTAHSPVGLDPKKYGIRVLPEPLELEERFARNDLPFVDPTPCDHDRLGTGLRRALYNFMQGAGLQEDVRFWFKPELPKGMRLPKTSVPRDLVQRALAKSS